MEISFIAWGALQLFETMRLQGLQPNLIIKPHRSVHTGLDSTEGLAPMRLRDVWPVVITSTARISAFKKWWTALRALQPYEQFHCRDSSPA